MARAHIRALVLEHGTDVDVVRTLRAATNIEAGLVVAAVPPDMRRGYELTWELLFALGKTNDVGGSGRDETINWEVLVAWILAHHIEHIVLVDAQWLRRSMFEDLVGVAAVTGTTLWLVAQDPLEDTYEAALELWPVEAASRSDLDQIIASASERPGPEPAKAFPRVPGESFVTFRAEARRLLDVAEFATVDERYRQVFVETQAWLCGQERLDGEAVLGLIRQQLHACRCADEMLCVVRAIQVAAFRSGWLLSADLDRLVITAERASAAAVHSPETWVRLRAYRQPYRGAACALAATELPLGAMTALTLAQVDPDGTAVRPAGRRGGVRIPMGAEVYLRAQVWHRRLQGADDHDPLFGGDQGPMRAKALADAIRCPLSELGVPVYSQRVERAEVDPVRWAKGWGLRVEEL